MCNKAALLTRGLTCKHENCLSVQWSHSDRVAVCVFQATAGGRGLLRPLGSTVVTSKQEVQF